MMASVAKPQKTASGNGGKTAAEIVLAEVGHNRIDEGCGLSRLHRAAGVVKRDRTGVRPPLGQNTDQSASLDVGQCNRHGQERNAQARCCCRGHRRRIGEHDGVRLSRHGLPSIKGTQHPLPYPAVCCRTHENPVKSGQVFRKIWDGLVGEVRGRGDGDDVSRCQGTSDDAGGQFMPLLPHRSPPRSGQPGGFRNARRDGYWDSALGTPAGSAARSRFRRSGSC
jgi:hypothetical protein